MKTCTPSQLETALKNSECRLMDVREPMEFEAESIPGANSLPLTTLDRECGKIKCDGPVYLVCRSGVRARQAAEKLLSRGFGEVFVLEGGMNAWTAAGKPVTRGASKVWDLERQVRFAAGSLVLAGTLLGAFWHPAFLALAGFVGAGLAFSGLTNTCGMAMLLTKMPWNRRPS